MYLYICIYMCICICVCVIDTCLYKYTHKITSTLYICICVYCKTDVALFKVHLPAIVDHIPGQALESLSREFEVCEDVVEKEAIILRAKGISIGYIATNRRNPTAGTVLQHCKRKAKQFRIFVGVTVCVFKIGFTSNPIFRFSKYRGLNYSDMCLLHVTPCKATAEMLEAALIDQHMGLSGCRNESFGGEGPGHIQAAHYYVYIVGARADQLKPIG